MAVSNGDVDEPQLQHIFPDRTAPRHASTYTIITIPDFDIRSVNASWRDETYGCWLQNSLSTLIPQRSDVLSFEPGLRLGKDFSWQHVVRQGDRFLEQLLSFQAQGKLGDRPLIFICHGLGGLLLKRAISVLSERFYDTPYQRLLSTVAGIIFLGTPSPKPNKPRDLERISTVLRFVTKHSSKSRRLSYTDITASISQRFSESGFEAPVLSIYENAVSKITRGIFSPRQVLVDKYLCETFTRRERIVGVDCSHDELSTYKKDTVLAEELQGFITMALEFFTVNGSLRTISNERQEKADRIEKKNVLRMKPLRTGTGFDSFPDLDTPTLTPGTGSPRVSSINSGFFDKEFTRLQPQNDHSPPSRRPRATLPCYILPHERNDGFFGREDILSKLDAALLPPVDPTTRSLRTFALCGVGGVGKSQTATEFVLSRRHRYDAIFWLHAADPVVLANEFAQLAERLKLGSNEKRQTMDDVMARSLVLQWLTEPFADSRHRSEPVNWLMVFDNAETLSVLKSYWPVTGKGSILVTSRDPLAKTQIYVHSTQGLDLEPFTKDDAATWLRDLTHYNAPGDVELSQTIVETLSGLPLAIAQVAGAMLRRGLSFAEFLQFYSEESFRLDIYQSALWRKPIWATFAFGDLSAEAAALLYVMCFFNPDAISETVFTTNAAGRKRAQELNFEGFPMNDVAYVSARTQLTSTSLVRRNVKKQELILHRVVQDAAMASMTVDRLTDAFRIALSLLSAAWPDSNFDFSTERWRLSEPLLPHVLRCVAQYEMNQSLQATADFNNEFAQLLQNAGWYQLERGAYIDSLPINRLALRLAEEAPDNDPLIKWACNLNLTEHGHMMTDQKLALEHAQKCLDIFEENPHLAERSEEVGIAYLTYVELAEAHISHHEYTSAIEFCDEAIKRRETDGTGRCAANAVIDKAHCKWRMGFPEEAWEILEAFLSNRDEIFGPPAPWKAALCLVEQGNVAAALGRESDSFEFYMKAYSKWLALFGRGHFHVAAMACKLGQHYHRVGDLAKAQEWFQQSISDYSDRPYYAAEICRTKFFLVRVLEQLGTENAPAARKRAEQRLLELSLKHGKRYSEDDLDELVALWAV